MPISDDINKMPIRKVPVKETPIRDRVQLLVFVTAAPIRDSEDSNRGLQIPTRG